MVFAIVLGLVLVCLYLVSIRPNPGRGERMRPFEEVLIAHRGLHENPAVPENSRTAFAKAAEAGYGIELDVQLTADDQLVVFHDETLQRVCGDPRKLHELTYAELADMRLLGTEEKIPLFRDVLALIGGRVPLLVEIKSEGRYTETTRLACEMLKTYDGIYIVESFHPMVLRQIRKEHPDVIRGQLSTHYTREKVEWPGYQRFLLTNLMLNFLSRPDFIAYDRQYPRQFSFRLCRALYHPVCFAWTVRSREELEEAKGPYQAYICERFLSPNEPSVSKE